jgi:hypothetical protein
MLYDAFEAAKETHEKDPGLTLAENAELKKRLELAGSENSVD